MWIKSIYRQDVYKMQYIDFAGHKSAVTRNHKHAQLDVGDSNLISFMSSLGRLQQTTTSHSIPIRTANNAVHSKSNWNTKNINNVCTLMHSIKCLKSCLISSFVFRRSSQSSHKGYTPSHSAILAGNYLLFKT